MEHGKRTKTIGRRAAQTMGAGDAGAEVHHFAVCAEHCKEGGTKLLTYVILRITMRERRGKDEVQRTISDITKEKM